MVTIKFMYPKSCHDFLLILYTLLVYVIAFISKISHYFPLALNKSANIVDLVQLKVSTRY